MENENIEILEGEIEEEQDVKETFMDKAKRHWKGILKVAVIIGGAIASAVVVRKFTKDDREYIEIKPEENEETEETE